MHIARARRDPYKYRRLLTSNQHLLAVRCYTELKPRWQNRLLDTETYVRDNCWAMIEALTVAIRS
jgi:hypothetical protein